MRIAVLDDYQHVALSCADWDSLGAEVVTFASHIADTGDLVAQLRPFDVIVAMRERTPFTVDADRAAARPAAARHHRDAQRLDRRGGVPGGRESPFAAHGAVPGPRRS